MLQVASTSILENPLIGAGLGMEGLVYAEHGLGSDWATHSIFLMVGSDLGIPGLLVYSLLFVQMLRGLRQTRRRLKPIPQAGELVAIALGLELAVWSYLFTAAFLPVAYDYTGYYLAGTAAAVRALGARLVAARTP
jgi:O-antigen ligase